MHFNSFLSADSYPKTAIIQYRKLRRYFKKYKFRIWVGELWNFFLKYEKVDLFLVFIIHCFSNTYEGSCFLAQE